MIKEHHLLIGGTETIDSLMRRENGAPVIIRSNYGIDLYIDYVCIFSRWNNGVWVYQDGDFGHSAYYSLPSLFAEFLEHISNINKEVATWLLFNSKEFNKNR